MATCARRFGIFMYALDYLDEFARAHLRLARLQRGALLKPTAGFERASS
jgi:hypothetical protein